MKLLIATQKVDINDDNLAFFHDWIKGFSKYFEKVLVICQYKGKYDLPEKVEVLSLGKEKKHYKNKIFRRIILIFLFYKYIWTRRKDYDAVFVHMIPEYVVLGGFFWKLWDKRTVLWFMHKSVRPSLRIAEKFVDVIFTGTKESFRLKSKKLKIVGHGINIEKFKFHVTRNTQHITHNTKHITQNTPENEVFRIITVGRISPSKDYETLIKAIAILKEKVSRNFVVEVIGGPGTPEQGKYFEKLKNQAKERGLDGIIEFKGSVSGKEIYGIYKNADLFVHMSQTGSLDKASLEAMASGVPALSCNDSVVKDVFQGRFPELVYKKSEHRELAEKMQTLMGFDEEKRNKLREALRKEVEENHNLKNLIKKIVKEMS